MAYDASRHYDATDDGHGGVRLRPRFRFRDIDATFLPRHQQDYPDDATRPQSNWARGRGDGFVKEVINRAQERLGDQDYEDPAKNEPKIVGRLPDPGDQMHYELSQDGDGGGWVICLVSGPDPDADNTGEWNTVGDRTMKHKLHGSDALLRQMNRDARRYWSRDTRTSDYENTVFRYGPLANGGSLKLIGPDEFGLYSVILMSPDDTDIAPRAPRRANGGDRGYGVNTEAAKIASMNDQAKRFWRR